MSGSGRNELGRLGEEAAARFLAARGYRILERNVRFRFGEIDMVAVEGDDLVFIEVRTRSSAAFGTPAESITAQKRQRLVRLAEAYLATRGGDRSCRFDLVAVYREEAGWSCELIQHAFTAG